MNNFKWKKYKIQLNIAYNKIEFIFIYCNESIFKCAFEYWIIFILKFAIHYKLKHLKKMVFCFQLILTVFGPETVC